MQTGRATATCDEEIGGMLPLRILPVSDSTEPLRSKKSELKVKIKWPGNAGTDSWLIVAGNKRTSPMKVR